ncbi:Rv1733c family protein [Pseudonocardia bannensis]|nr:DUF1918 domain-containing protein [Pseudonocardia bannensis]
MRAHVGDWLVLPGRPGEPHGRRGRVVGLVHPDGSPPYRVRWLADDHESVVSHPRTHISNIRRRSTPEGVVAVRAEQEHRPPARVRSARRFTDRVEDAVAWLLSSLVLLTLLVAVLVGLQVHGQESQRARAEADSRTPVRAVLLEATPNVPGVEPGRMSPPVRVAVRWFDADGAEHLGKLTVHGPRPAGTEVRAWVDRRGELVGAPLTAGGATLVAVAAAAGVLIAGWSTLAVAGLGVRRWVRARNDARWTREWARIEPVWTGRNR